MDDEGKKWGEQKANGDKKLNVIAYDFGIKENILRHLSSYGANVTVITSYSINYTKLYEGAVLSRACHPRGGANRPGHRNNFV